MASGSSRHAHAPDFRLGPKLMGIPEKVERAKGKAAETDELQGIDTQAFLPILSLQTGQRHPKFPQNMQALNRLTSKDLDELAIFYDQFLPPGPYTNSYPGRMKKWIGTPAGEQIGVEAKRVQFGVFFGLIAPPTVVVRDHGLAGVPDVYNPALDPGEKLGIVAILPV